MQKFYRRVVVGKLSQEVVEKRCAANGYTVESQYLGSFSPLTCIINKCGHSITSAASNFIRGRNIVCPVCSPSRRTKRSSDITKELEEHGVILVDTYVNMKTNILVRNIKCNHVYTINPGHFLYSNIGEDCPICKNTGIRWRFFSKLLDNGLELLESSEYLGTQTPISILNTNCGHEYSVIPNNLVSTQTGIVCPACTPSGRSNMEMELVDFIKQHYSGWIVFNDRNVIEPYELDIVLPDLGIAFEFCGGYWHSETKRGKDYHSMKYELSSNNGYKLIQIFNDDWTKHRDIVKSRILNLLGKSNKIYARKCKLRKIDYPKLFLDINHIQGAGTISSYNYGLFFNEELVAVMTFSRPRFTSAQDFELVRFCSKLNTVVIGGASRLFNAFLEEMPNSSIVSYSDRKWSAGSLYKLLGFTHSHTSPPNYRYYSGNISLSRYQCQKHLLKSRFPKHYDPKLSEPEIMANAGYSRVFDAGSDVWIYTLDTCPNLG